MPTYDMRISDWSSDVCSSDLRYPGGLGEAVEEMLHHLRVPFADALHGEIRLEHQPGTPGNVQRHAGQRLVHRGIDAAVAGYAALVAQRLGNRLADGDGGVLDRQRGG